MQAADLRDPITIERRVETASGAESWATVAQVRASVVALRGAEFIGGIKLSSEVDERGDRQLVAEVDTRVKLRYVAGLAPDMRVIDAAGNVYDIRHVIDREGRRRELEILAVRRVA